MLVRVIEYRVDGQPDVVRLITSLTDHEKFPAGELAALYARRWEIELVFDEIKTHQRGRPVLRSQTPGGVRQEIYAHLIVHHATRDLLNEAAHLHRSTAERTSFTRALHVVRRSVISPSGFSPSAIKRDRRLGLAEIGRSLLPRRRSRDCPRKIRSCVTGYGSKPQASPPAAAALRSSSHSTTGGATTKATALEGMTWGVVSSGPGVFVGDADQRSGHRPVRRNAGQCAGGRSV
ncbi:transposase [Streptomyces sp. NBC_00341]|uniref:transposase n=1 Tax=Streptomyces sp. NBC_00341 TaxID=2975717 RepID=UPI00308EA3B5|nr:transposase [Streptomyces sp. NBC_00341]